ncbi:hypothetical protein ACL02O_28030 [Micromonospora sp. MS34]|uniref:hypothetical protein n=1 Tax=Micromonospora sp. MS34 TaxID=3385971 RepID=UPI0039A12079
MIAILTLLVALPLGLLIRNRLAAYLTYAVVFGQVYTFQSLNLILEWVNGSSEAFTHDKTAGLGATLPYLIVTSAIYAAGFGLVTLGHWLRNRRRSATATEVRLDGPTV